MSSLSNKLDRLRELANHYNASQPRDEDGKWTRGDGSSHTGVDKLKELAKGRKSKGEDPSTVLTKAEMQEAKLTPLVVTNAQNSMTIFKCKIKDTKYFVKGIPATKLARAEIATAEAAQAMGFENVLPAAVSFREINGVKMNCIFTPFLKGSDLEQLGDTQGTERITKEQALDGLLFDYVLGNVDRHAGNMFLDDGGNLKLIDHELCFVVEDKELDRGSPFYRKFDPDCDEASEARLIKLPEATVQRIIDAEPKVMDVLKKYHINPARANAVQARIAVLKEGQRRNNLRMGLLLDQL